MVNMASIKCNLSRGQNSYLGLILPPEQYACLSGTAFVLPPNSGRTAQVPACTLPMEDKHIIREHAEQRQLYNKYRTVDSALKNQLIVVFNDPYLTTLRNEYTWYATRSTMEMISHIHKQYDRISSTNMVANGERLCTPYNTDEPLKSLIKTLNECTKIFSAAREPVTETQLVRIAYRLFAETG